MNVDWLKLSEELRASVASIMARFKKVPGEDMKAARDAMVKMLTKLLSAVG